MKTEANMRNCMMPIIRLPINNSRSVIVLLICFLFVTSCTKEREPDSDGDDKIHYNPSIAYTLKDISYGKESQQKMDIYLPADRNAQRTKVFVLIHGGGWSEGDKVDFADFFAGLKNIYPDHAVINLNYQLATSSSPGYPKQINDIQAALSHIQLPRYNLSRQYFLVGISAGAHLALLYGYAFDTNHYVKGICNTVGPADLTDPACTNNVFLMSAISSLLGSGILYADNPGLYEEVSPAKRVTPSSPATISFYGDSDPLIPVSQMPRLHNALDANGVYNEAIMYPNAGHGTWSQTQTEDYVTKMLHFINQHF